MRHNTRAHAAVLALLALMLGACAKPVTPGVRVNSVNTDLGLGAPTPTPTPVADLPDVPDFPDIGIQIPPFKPIPIPPPVVQSCEEAGAFEFPEQEATPALRGTPTEGTYRWVYDITIIDPDALAAILPEPPPAGTFQAFGTREVFGIGPDVAQGVGPEPLASTTDRDVFMFSMDQKGLALGPTVNTVRRNDRFRVVPSSPLDTEQTQQDAGEGLYYFTTFRTEQTETSSQSWTMAYGPPLQLIAFPVVIGQEVRSASTAPEVDITIVGGNTNFQRGRTWSFVLDGVVRGREHIDACGDVVDAWLVDATLTLAAASEANAAEAVVFDYDYAVATQLGGIVVYEQLAYPAEDPALIIQARMGQIVPTPLPEGE